MFSNSTIKYVEQILSILIAKGATIKVKPGTSLYAIIEGINHSLSACGKIDLANDSITFDEKYSSKDIIDQIVSATGRSLASLKLDSDDLEVDAAEEEAHIYPFENILEGVADGLAKATLAQVRHSRTVAYPLIKAFLDSANAKIDRLPSDPLRDINVIYDELPELASNGLFIESIETSSLANSPLAPIDSITKEELSFEEIKEWLSTGVPTLNVAINELCDLVSPKIVEGMYYTFFTNGDNNITIDSKDIKILCLAYLMFLVAGVTPPKEATVALNEIKKHCAGRTHLYAKDIMAHFAAYEVAVKDDVVIKTILSDREVIVYGAPYAKFLESGGTQETILGAMISKDFARSALSLMNNKDKLESAWNLFLTNATREMSLNKTLKLSEIYRNTFWEFSTSELLPKNETVRPLKDAARIVDRYIAKIPDDEFTDVGVHATNIMCAFFQNTDDVKFFGLLQQAHDDAQRIGIEISNDEAATIATFGYISDWLVDQVDVVVTHPVNE